VEALAMPNDHPVSIDRAMIGSTIICLKFARVGGGCLPGKVTGTFTGNLMLSGSLMWSGNCSTGMTPVLSFWAKRLKDSKNDRQSVQIYGVFLNRASNYNVIKVFIYDIR